MGAPEVPLRIRFEVATANARSPPLSDQAMRVFDPDAVRILIAVFDSPWQSIKTSEAKLSNEQIELMRATLAKYIIEQARHGELDQGRLRDGALVHLAQSNLRYPPPARK